MTIKINLGAEEGKWIVAGIEILEGESFNYEATIANVLSDIHYNHDAEIVLCGGLRHIHQPVALVMNNEEVELLIPLYDLEISGEKKQINRMKPADAQEEDKVYLYSEIKDAVNKMKDTDENSVGAGAYIKLSKEEHGMEVGYPIVIAIVLFGGTMAIVYGIRKKSKSYKF